MIDTRPDPDTLLAEVAREEARGRRGKLKIFFGSNAGVGKTYAMLDEARKRAAEGANLLIGYAEPHIRPETEALLLGLDILPYKLVTYKDATLKEFDLDGALARKPTLVCVDELAHTNAPGLRHPKRWQDVDELLNAGINVYTTLNVQHLESVNDIVERITGIKVRETLPDRIFDEADEVELVDIAPDELIERLQEGRIYKPQQVAQALKHFFNRGNLIALRELALRKTAERVDAQMLDARRTSASSKTWAASERILTCIGPSPFAPQLVRTTKRLAAAFRAPWIAAYVEVPGRPALSPAARERLGATQRLVEQMGGEIVTLSGADVAEELLAYAQKKNITKIVVGKPEQPRWREWLFGSIVNGLIRSSGPIDVYVIRHEREPGTKPLMPRLQRTSDWRGYVWAALVAAVTTFLGAFLYHFVGHGGRDFSNANVLMLYLLGVLLVAARFGRGPAVLASLLSVALFDFTVVPPYLSFAVSDTQYLLTFAVMLATGLFISTLTHRIRQQAELSRLRERRTAALLSLSKNLAAARDATDVAAAVAHHAAEIFDSPVVIMLPDAHGALAPAAFEGSAAQPDEKERGVIQWTFDHAEPAGRGTSTLPSSAGLYFPLTASGGTAGVLGLINLDDQPDPDRLRLLEAFANQAAVALERVRLAEESRRAWERVESEFVRNTLLSGVSHDLRTPLAAIIGAASSLVESGALPESARHELALSIVSESERMERLINNLLDMTRLEAGGLHLRKEWQSLDEIIGSALTHARKQLAGRQITVHLAPDTPLLQVDAVAMEQVLANLLDNAAAYTPAGSPVEISARRDGDHIVLEVADHGPGLPEGAPQQVFQKFFRGKPQGNHALGDDGSRRGIGLGLAVCKGIVELHGGTITADNRLGGYGGGAVFTIRLPAGRPPPAPPPEESV